MEPYHTITSKKPAKHAKLAVAALVDNDVGDKLKAAPNNN